MGLDGAHSNSDAVKGGGGTSSTTAGFGADDDIAGCGAGGSDMGGS